MFFILQFFRLFRSSSFYLSAWLLIQWHPIFILIALVSSSIFSLRSPKIFFRNLSGVWVGRKQNFLNHILVSFIMLSICVLLYKSEQHITILIEGRIRASNRFLFVFMSPNFLMQYSFTRRNEIFLVIYCRWNLGSRLFDQIVPRYLKF